jgi:hypothetical protein
LNSVSPCAGWPPARNVAHCPSNRVFLWRFVLFCQLARMMLKD